MRPYCILTYFHAYVHTVLCIERTNFLVSAGKVSPSLPRSPVPFEMVRRSVLLLIVRTFKYNGNNPNAEN